MEECASEINRLQKLLKRALINLKCALSEITGVAAHDILR
jgi:hypothetical protein